MLVGGHPSEPETTVLAATKTHLGRCPAALGFMCATGSTGPRVHWTGPVDLRADELCIPRTGALVRGPRERAAEFLVRALATGPRPVDELERLAAEKGVSWRMVRRIKQSVHVISERARGNPHSWVWRMTSPDPEPEQAPKDETRDLLLYFAQAKGVDTRGLGNNPSSQDVIDLLRNSVGAETLRGWIAELRAESENRQKKECSGSPPDGLNGSFPVGRARTDQEGVSNRSDREGDDTAPRPSTSLPHPSRRQTHLEQPPEQRFAATGRQISGSARPSRIQSNDLTEIEMTEVTGPVQSVISTSTGNPGGFGRGDRGDRDDQRQRR
jgi:hypothetical protein